MLGWTSLKLTFKAPVPQNGQTYLSPRQFADELFKCVWPFCGVGA